MSEKLAPIILSDKMSTAINGFFAAIYYVVSRNDVLKKKKKTRPARELSRDLFSRSLNFRVYFCYKYIMLENTPSPFVYCKTYAVSYESLIAYTRQGIELFSAVSTGTVRVARAPRKT